jgi:hypothetical protein
MEQIQVLQSARAPSLLLLKLLRDDCRLTTRCLLRIAGAQIQSQQSNIALLSALLLTIQFAFLYAFPATWSDLISDSYLANLMTEGELEVLHEVIRHFIQLILLSNFSNLRLILAPI